MKGSLRARLGSGAGIRSALERFTLAAALITAAVAFLPHVDSLAAPLTTWWVGKLKPDADPALVQQASLPVGILIAITGVLTLASAVGAVITRFVRQTDVLAVLVVVLTTAGAVIGHRFSPWLGTAVPLAVVFVGATFGSQRDDVRATDSSAFVLSAEGGALALAALFPHVEHHPGFVITTYAIGFGASAVLASRIESAARARLAALALPCTLLPLTGLARNPTSYRLALLLALLVGWAILVQRSARAIAVVERIARTHGVWLAVTSICLPLVLPFGFRDLATADWKGHEAPHLAWVNSIAHGRWMMADAGFVYGPLREYTLGALAVLYGGLNLEHMRMAHITCNVVGMGTLLYAMVRFVGARPFYVVLAAVLLLLHSTLTAYVVYTNTYSFGWADSLRAGAAILAIAVACGQPETTRRTRIIAGAIAGVSLFYSHDFGALAIVAGAVGVFARRMAASREVIRVRARAAAVEALHFGIGVATSTTIFVLPYIVTGRGLALFNGFRWAARVALGTQAFTQTPFPIHLDHLRTPGPLLEPIEAEGHLGLAGFDYVAAPAIAILGLAHATAAAVRGTFRRSTAAILSISLIAIASQRHVLLSSDGWHCVNAATAPVVLFVLLVFEARGAKLRLGRTFFAWGSALAVLGAAVWLSIGQMAPLEERLGRLTSGSERPSFGPAYQYDDLPRAGDVLINPDHLEGVRFIRAHTQPTDAVFSTTWLLGGGVEAFLGDRRNPTPFDTPQECVSEAMQKDLLRILENDPPVLIVGDFFDFYGPEGRAYIEAHWMREPTPFRLAIWTRRSRM